MQKAHIIELHGSITLENIPQFSATPSRVLVLVTHPGLIPKEKWLASCTQQYSAAPIPYLLHLDTRTFKAGEALDLEAFLYAGTGEGAEQARVKIPLTLNYDIARVEQNITIVGTAPPVEPLFERIAGTVTVPNLGELSGHQLSVGLHEIRINENGKQVATQICESGYQLRNSIAPFSLNYDKRTLGKDDVSYLLMCLVFEPSGKYVAGRQLHPVALDTLGTNMQLKLGRTKE